jgi:hypothetical protein
VAKSEAPYTYRVLGSAPSRPRILMPGVTQTAGRNLAVTTLAAFTAAEL